MRIIIYALGKKFEQYKDKLNWEDIIALADKNIKSPNKINEIPVIMPSAIRYLEYDYIAVFSDYLFEEIKRELVGEYFICKDKIIPWKVLIGEEIAAADSVQLYQKFFSGKKCKKILDIGMSILPQICLTKEEVFSEDDVMLDGLLDEDEVPNGNIYDHIFKELSDCKDYYDAILLNEIQEDSDIKWGKIGKYARYILMHARYSLQGKITTKVLKEKLQKQGKLTYISTLEGIFLILDTKSEKVLSDISLYIVMHKNYNSLKDSFYKPLCVGGYEKEGYLTEQKGENIAYLNSKINECTALYWIWKNTSSKYVGLNHYRRYFYKDEIRSMDNYLDIEYASELLDKYDIILPKANPSSKIKILDQIRQSINSKLCEKAYLMVRGKFEKKQPDYLQAFDSVMEGYNAFLCNMFVTRREILNEYCEWLFSFLIEAAEEMDVTGYDPYSQRVVGFFAERMWTVWLRKNRLKIKELPYVVVK